MRRVALIGIAVAFEVSHPAPAADVSPSIPWHPALLS